MKNHYTILAEDSEMNTKRIRAIQAWMQANDDLVGGNISELWAAKWKADDAAEKIAELFQIKKSQLL